MISFLLVSAVYAQVVFAITVHPTEDYQAVVELPEWDFGITIPPQKVIDECTKRLAHEQFLAKREIIQAYEQRALAYRRSRQYDLANKDYEAILKVSPCNKNAQLGKSACLPALGRETEVPSCIEELLRQHPNFSKGLVERAVNCIAGGDYDRGVLFSDQAIAKDKENSYALLVRSQAYLLKGDFQKSLQDISRAVELNPLVALVVDLPGLEFPYLRRAELLTVFGRYAEAAANVQMALFIAPSSPVAQFDLWRLFSETGRRHLALRAAEQLVLSDKRVPAGWAALGYTRMTLKQRDEAFQALKEAQQMNSRDPINLCLIGSAFEQVGNYAAALEKYEEALKADPHGFYTNRCLARLYAGCPEREFRNGKKAVELARELCRKTNDENIDCLHILATAYEECGQVGKAKEALKKCIKKSNAEDCSETGELHNRGGESVDNAGIREVLEIPAWYRPSTGTISREQIIKNCTNALGAEQLLPESQISSLHIRRGEAYLTLAKIDLAKNDFDAVLKLSPGDETAILGKATALFQQGKRTEAIRECEELLKNQPNFVDGLVTLAAFLLKSGEVSESMQLSSRALAIDGANARAVEIQGITLYLDGQFVKAFQNTSRAILLDPLADSPYSERPYLRRGMLLLILGRYSQAAANFRMALCLDRGCFTAKYGMWRVYSETARPHLALFAARELIRMDNSKALSWAALANSLSTLGQEKEASEALEKAVASDSRDAEALGIVGSTLEKQGKFGAALEKYDEALHVDPKNPFATRYKAHFYACCSKPAFLDRNVAKELAKTICDQTENRHVGCLRILSSAMNESGEFEKSAGILRKCLELAGEEDAGVRDELQKELAAVESRSNRKEKPSGVHMD